MSFRHIYMLFGCIGVVGILLLSDPDSGFIQNLPVGAGTVSMLIILVTSILYVAMLHISRKGLIDYVDMKSFFKKALETSEGAGSALIAVGLIMIAISIVIFAATN